MSGVTKPRPAAVRRLFSARGIAWRRPAVSVLAREYGVVVSFSVLFVVLAIASPAFLRSGNIENILTQNAALALIAVGATIVIIGGCFDLSVGTLFALAGVVAALVSNAAGPALGVAAGLATGVGAGVINGVLVAALRVNSFVATLATSLIFGGIATIATGGLLITIHSSAFTALGNGSILGVNTEVVICLVCAVVAMAVMRWTRFGRYTYSIGGNQVAARYSGVRVAWVRFAAFVVSGVLAGLAGVLEASRAYTGQADVGSTLPLTAIAAVVIGGTSIKGGRGAIWKSLLGVLVLALIGNGFDLLGVSADYQSIIQGAIIIGAVAADALSSRDVV